MTNASAMTALQSLNATNKALEQTQGRISTGYRVAEASDNAAYWSIATTMRSDNKANSVVQDALGLGAGKVDTAYTAMNSALSVVDQIKQKVLLAKTSGPEERAKIQSEIDTYVAQLRDSINGASYAGANLLQTSSATGEPDKVSIISAYNRDSGGNVSTTTIDIAFTNIRLIDGAASPAIPAVIDNTDPLNPIVITPAVPAVPGTGILDKLGTASGISILDIDLATIASIVPKDNAGNVIASPTESDKFDALLTDIENALGDMADAAAELGASKSRIDMQKDFVSKLMDSIDKGVGQLVDADMNKESTKLQALQVQQQLGIQALSIANGNSQSILALFKG